MVAVQSAGRIRKQNIPAGPGSVDVGLDDREVAQRVELLTRFRQLLLKQRDRFRTYLSTLEEEGDAIRKGDVEHFERHVQLEQSIVKDIISFRRAVEPLEDLYHSATGRNAGDEGDIPELQAHLEHLQAQVLKRNEENRQELRSRLDELRQQVARIRAPREQSAYAAAAARSGRMVDITT